MISKPAIFLDRDGTLNYDPGYVYKVKDFKLLPSVIEGLKLLKEKFLFFIITNQSGIGRGYYTIQDFHNFNVVLLETLEKENIKIQKIYFCPHHPDEDCDCRKPNPKNILLAAKEFNIDLKKSWMIGDHPSDVQCGTNAGCKTIYLSTGHGKKHFSELKQKGIQPTYMAKNFMSAVEFILKHD